ncbi:methyltransferase type 11 [Actinorhabdospora filicis]|uniref:Methyltransferase type 11 n=1 Tax=Actinorhabdospora filicis TaxID=1785913 RepID=A0A9W6WDJ1_9ACTN|nr:methyltransferase domain-containing protein [Actinorhabdospora filicis]GLZ81666.1 methyltransferase type 11 [Actinorhabdospora filicis]
MEQSGRSGPEVGSFYDMTFGAFDIIFEGTIHTGYWGRGATTFPEAQRDLTDLVLDAAAAPTGGRVLDLGCGQGGPALHTARRLNTDVLGVTVSAAQVADATSRAAKAGLAGKVAFELADMTAMTYPDASFDAAYAMESVFHVADKATAFAGVNRVLKPGAHFVICDYYLAHEQPAEDTQLMHDLIFGSPFVTLEAFQRLLEDAGFEFVAARDITEDCRASAAHMTEAVTDRHEALVHAVGDQAAGFTAEAVKQYNRLCVDGQGYAVITARKPQ